MTELIKKTRELGKLIQQSDEFAAVQRAMELNTQDAALMGLMQQLHMAESGYAAEAHSENPSESKMQAYKDEFERLYSIVMKNPTMGEFQEAQKSLGELMNQVFGILTQCADGEDPDTCQVPQEHNHKCDCGGECGNGCSCG
ncbi:MAG: YlbF family regulator [Clostridium sp.]|jgi:cell fate (sporulation/competence/biofilm development) regulator YlbF (YheA/YmcA/DUF963 family)|nr:YlbF family regulator [Clostridium sp.]